ncbi:hypothetical protein SETIT_2G094800v2 [Setaria italica]|uniref:Uncharacterized protein n=1 Tax=Setaria italica TaxID=4555 RepID=K3ZY54_SETIT|nr:uncharacterized protein LOC101759795 [Setaria italica]RCV10218.1 hypothetical protein SETIT_2G094800v2 [Setaria italica]
MASSVSFGTVAPAVASPAGGRSTLGRRAARPSTARTIPAATKMVAAAKQEQKGLFDAIFGALYKEEQLLETDPILNKVEGKAPAAAPASKTAAGKAAAAAEQSGGNGGFLGGLFNNSKKG